MSSSKRKISNVTDLIGRIVRNYDPGRCERQTEDGKWVSEERYDEDCETYRLITGIIKTPTEYILCGLSISPGNRASMDMGWNAIVCPFAVLTEHEMSRFLSEPRFNGREMYPVSGIVNQRIRFVGFKPGSKDYEFADYGTLSEWNRKADSE